MKKTLAIVLCLVLALGLVACGSTSTSTSTATSTPASSVAADSASGEVDEVTAALTDAKIGVQLGTTGDIYITGDVEGGLYGSASVEEYNKGADAVQALLTGKIDAVVIDNEPAKAFVAANEGKLQILDTQYVVEDYSICISKDNAELTAAFNDAIAQIKENGTLGAIMDKYINGVEGSVGYVTPDGTEYPNGTLTMATNAAFEPYEFYDADGNVTGIDVEFATAICDILGYELKVEDMEFDSIIAAVQGGKADFGAAGMTVTEERLQSIDFTDSYSTGVQVVIVRAE